MTSARIVLFFVILLGIGTLLKGQVSAEDTVLANRYELLAYRFHDSGNFDSALHYYGLTEKIYSGIARDDRDTLFLEKSVEFQNLRGFCLNELGRHQDSKSLLYQTLGLGKKELGENHLEVAQTYYYLGLVYNAMSNWDSALICHQFAFATREAQLPELDEKLGESFMLMGMLYIRKQEYTLAEENLSEALKIVRIDSAENFLKLGNVIQYLGIIFYQQSKYDEAQDYYQQAAEIYTSHSLEESLGLASVYNNMSSIFSLKGDYQKALEYSQYVIKILLKLKGNSSYEVGTAYNKLANLFQNVGEYANAITYHQLALAIFEDKFGKNNYYVAMSFNNLAIDYWSLNDYSQALHHFQQARDIWGKNKDAYHLELASVLNNTANVYTRMKNYDQALKNHQEALKIRLEKLVETHPEIGNSYRNIGLVYQQKEDWDSAIEYVQQSIAVFSPAHTDPSYRINANQINFTPHKHFLAALSSRASIFEHRFESHGNIKDLEAALDTYEQLIELNEYLRISYVREGSKELLGQSSASLYNNCMKVGYTLWEASKEPELVNRIFKLSEKSRANLLNDALRTSDARVYSGIPSEVLVMESELRKDLAAIEQSLHREKLKGQKADSSLIDSTELRLFQRKLTYDSLLQVLENNHPRYYELKYDVSVASIEHVQASFRPGTALVKYFWGEKDLYTFTITRDTVLLYRTSLDSNLTDLIEQFIQYINDPDQSRRQRDPDVYQQFVTQAYSVFEKILQSAFPQNIDQLIIIPDGLLGYVPFELLLSEPNSFEGSEPDYSSLPYLLKNYRIRYEYSAALLLKNDQSRLKTSHLFAGYAPVYRGSGLNHESKNGQTRNIEGLRGIRLDSLLYNQSEIERIANKIKGESFLGEFATEAAFKQEAGNYRVLHLAMHTVLNDSMPSYSGLAFTQNNDSTEDGFLYVSEICNLSLRAILTVLSACETGKGKLVRSEGIMSMARAFKYAGTPNIVMSLWPVNDRSTEELMVRFYDHLTEGQAIDEALRQAKLDLISEGEFSHPHYWAPFVFVGDDTPISFSSSYRTYFWLLLMLVMMGIALIIFRKNRQRVT